MTAALPTRATVSYRPSGSAKARLGGWKIVLAAGAALACIVVGANVLLLVNEPGAVTGLCTPTAPCGPPPPKPIRLGEEWTSRRLGYSFEYDAGLFSKIGGDANGVRLELRGNPVVDGTTLHLHGAELWIQGAPATDKEPAQLLRERLSAFSRFGLVEDNDSATTILGPSIGFVSGVGGSYAGTSGASAPVTIAIIAAGNSRVSAVVSFVLDGNIDPAEVSEVRGLGDLVLKTFRWP